ncbi:MAG: HEAT repeat domain-containing protein [Nitrospinota bacterium]
MSRVSELKDLLALDDPPTGRGPLGRGAEGSFPPGWGTLAAGRIVADAAPGEVPPGLAGAVAGLLVNLYWKGTFAGQRRRALDLLFRLGTPEVPRYFLQAAKSPDARVRAASAEALGGLSGARVLEGLRSLLKDVRAAACLALGAQGERSALALLVERLKDESGKVRRSAAEALGRLGDPAAAAPLTETLEDLGIAVRKKAAEALGRIGDPATLETLAGRLRTGSVPEKWGAADALADWNAPEAVAPLAAALSDPSARVRKRATYALGNLPFPEVVDPLGRALEDDAEEVRRRAAYALGLIPSPRAAGLLVKALWDESASVRKKAADSLAAFLAWALEDAGAANRGDGGDGRRASEEVRAALGALLGGPDDDLRLRAAFGLARCGDPGALDVVRETAGRPASPFRRKALAVLGEAGGEPDVEILKRGMEDADPAVRRAAAAALGRMRSMGEEVEVRIEQALAGALEDPEARVRDAAFESWMARRERKERESV